MGFIDFSSAKFPDFPKTGKKYFFYFSEHQIKFLNMEFGVAPVNEAVLDSGKIARFTESYSLNWKGEINLPSDAVYLGEGYRLDDLPEEFVSDEINKLIDNPLDYLDQP